MTELQTAQALDKAELLCKSQGLRLTPKRKQVLKTLLINKKAFSAYEIAENYYEDHHEKIPVMSIYRILDFFIEVDFVHKLQSTNKFISCSHLSCDHAHDLPQFLICLSCDEVEEIAIAPSIIYQLKQSVDRTGFELKQHQLELSGYCKKCKSTI